MANQSVIDILEELEATAGSLAKREILETNKQSDLLKRVFIAAGDPYVVYYVNKFPMPSARPTSNAGPDDVCVGSFLEMVSNDLATRRLTGNEAKAWVVGYFASMTALQQKWCQRILLKNMRCGVQTTVNKVWPDAIKTFDVALAETLKSTFVTGEGIKILEEVTYPVRVEPKLDGLRCIAVKENGKVTLFTRNGTELSSMPTIRQALEAASYDNIVLDGEGLADDWNQSASIMMSKTQKDDSNLRYNIFDAMSLGDWINQECSVPYSDRCDVVSEVVTACGASTHNGLSIVTQVPHIMAKDEAELKAFFAKCMDSGFEGVMLKTLGTHYKFKRSSNILKLKPCCTYEGVIVGHYEGRRGTKREGLFGGFEVLLPNGAITRLGGGFSDVLKAEIQLKDPATYIGDIVELEAQPDPLTLDGLTRDGKARFPVYTRHRDPSDVDPKVVAAYKTWLRAS